MNFKNCLQMVVRPYRSENHLGYNALVQMIKGTGEACGTLYVSFDHALPRFLWEASDLSYSEREYLELVALQSAEMEIRRMYKKA